MSEETDVVIAETPSAETPSATPESQNTEASETQAQETTEVDSGGEDSDDPEKLEADKAIKRGKNYYARKIDQKERELQQANRRVDALIAMQGQKQAEPPQAIAVETPPKRDDFTDFESWIRADATFAAKQAARAEYAQSTRAQQDAQRQQQTLTQAQQLESSFRSKLEKGTEKISDFHEVVNASDVPTPPHVAMSLAQLDDPAGVMYYLAKNPDVGRSLSTMNALQVATKLGAIQAGLQAPAKPSSAPKPGRPVGGKPSANSVEAPSDMDAYLAWRKKQRG